MRAILDIVMIVLNLYFWVVIIAVVFSWLLAFNVVNTYNRFVAVVAEALFRATEPLLGRIRQYMPNLGGIDVSPIVLLLGIILLQRVIVLYVYPSVF